MPDNASAARRASKEPSEEKAARRRAAKEAKKNKRMEAKALEPEFEELLDQQWESRVGHDAESNWLEYAIARESSQAVWGTELEIDWRDIVGGSASDTDTRDETTSAPGQDENLAAESKLEEETTSECSEKTTSQCSEETTSDCSDGEGTTRRAPASSATRADQPVPPTTASSSDSTPSTTLPLPENGQTQKKVRRVILHVSAPPSATTPATTAPDAEETSCQASGSSAAGPGNASSGCRPKRKVRESSQEQNDRPKPVKAPPKRQRKGKGPKRG